MMKPLDTFAGIPITGALEPDGAGGFVLRLRMAVPVLNRREPEGFGTLGLYEAVHMIPSEAGCQAHDALDFAHLYSIANAFVGLSDAVEDAVEGGRKKSLRRLGDMMDQFEEDLDIALATLGEDDVEDDIVNVLTGGWTPERVQALLAKALRAAEQIGYPRTEGESDRSYLRRALADEDATAAIMGLGGPGEGPASVWSAEAEGAGQTADAPSAEAPAGKTTSKPGKEKAKAKSTEGAAPTPPKAGDVRTVVVKVTKNQVADYGARGVFLSVATTIFPGKAEKLDLDITIPTAEAMFTDAIEQGKVRKGPQRRMFLTAAERLRAALNRDPA